MLFLLAAGGCSCWQLARSSAARISGVVINFGGKKCSFLFLPPCCDFHKRNPNIKQGHTVLIFIFCVTVMHLSSESVLTSSCCLRPDLLFTCADSYKDSVCMYQMSITVSLRHFYRVLEVKYCLVF
jgi:hypothetical protein